MSVDYASVLIYGYRIPAEEVKRIKENIGDEAWIVATEYFDVTMGEMIRKTLPIALIFCAAKISSSFGVFMENI